MGALTESQSREILEGLGIPFARSIEAKTPDEALEKAREIGFPVVLKGMAPGVAHKSEHGLVATGIADGESVLKAAVEMQRLGEAESFLVQEQVKGRREFIAGFFRDPTFGPMVSFGLGGVMAEALGDVVHAPAPLYEASALRLVGSIKASKLLCAFRGEDSADVNALAKILVALSQLAIKRGDIAEAEINPLIVSPNGSVTAVDALVVEGAGPARPKMCHAADTSVVQAFLNPSSVAFIGATTGLGKWGQSLPANLIAGGYKGEVVFVHPRGGEQWGRVVYQQIADMPKAPDLAVITTPAQIIPQIIPELGKKGCKLALVISSGFSDVGEEGEKLEAQCAKLAREWGVTLMGPNTMGISNPHQRLFITGSHIHSAPGGTAIISQSGNMGVQLLSFADHQGLGVRAFLGTGNSAMINVEDCVEAFGADPLATSIIMYIESVGDGARFVRSVKRASLSKPVVILKGGVSEEGEKASKSHTGAMAVDDAVFRACASSAGAVLTDNPVELMDASIAFDSQPLPKGSRVAILTFGGGWGVVASDLCSRERLQLPPLSQDIERELSKLLPPYWSKANPIDLVGQRDLELPVRAMEILAGWEGCDAILHLGLHGFKNLMFRLLDSTQKVDPSYTAQKIAEYHAHAASATQKFIDAVAELSASHGKTILGVGIDTPPDEKTVLGDGVTKCVIFPSPERAVKALGHMARYSAYLKTQKPEE